MARMRIVDHDAGRCDIKKRRLRTSEPDQPRERTFSCDCHYAFWGRDRTAGELTGQARYNRRMSARVFFDVDPATLRLPQERLHGADPAKLQRQIARHGKSLSGMPPVLVYQGSDGELILSDGVTRATRAAKLCPGSVIPAELLGSLPYAVGHLPTVQEKLP